MYLTSPPAVYEDSLIVGSAIDDNERADAPHGIVRALDARTGTVKWSFDPIPATLQSATGAANVWAGITIDTARNIAYLPTSSPSADSFGGTRTQEVPLADALVAVNATTGELLWHFQAVHHDLFDYDLPTQPALFDLHRDNHWVPAVAQVTKTGFVYLLDSLTGQPLFPIEERRVPESDVPGESASPTQPFSSIPALARQRIDRAGLFGLTWLDLAACRRTFDTLTYRGMFTPPSLKGSLQFPSAAGGANWGSAAIDPGRQILVVRTQNIANIVRLRPASDEVKRTAISSSTHRPLWGTPYAQENGYFASPLGLPCVPPPWGELTALDLTSGKTLWHVPLGRFRKGVWQLPQRWGSPGAGGPLVTASGLVFIGASLDPTFRAFDIASGKTLWKAGLPAPAMTVPMSYIAGNRQFIVVAAGGSAFAGTQLADALVAFSLTPTSSADE